MKNKASFVISFMAFGIVLVLIPLSIDSRIENPIYALVLRILLSESIDQISVSEAQQLQAPIWLDTRTWPEYEISHIKDAIWVGESLSDKSFLDTIAKTQTIVVYCSIGYRSENLSYNLTRLGYTKTRNLYGGIFEWVNQKYPVYNQCAIPTKRIHSYNKFWKLWVSAPTETVWE